MVRRLRVMLEITLAAGFRPTCPITATVLARHPRGAMELAEGGMELAVHGLRHNDHLAESAATQSREIAEAVRLFEECGLQPKGFRAPYLRANAATAAAVRAVGLTYQSDTAIAFPVPGLGTSVTPSVYQRALTMYRAADGRSVTTRPSVVDGIVRIPVAIPDDEMLVDRLHFSEAACARAWHSILETTHARGDLFTMQIHPERIDRSASALASVIERASSAEGGVWLARLDEIADWWLARHSCRIEMRIVGDGRAEFVVHGDPRVRMSLVGGAQPIPPDLRHKRALVLPVDPMPAISVEPGTSESILQFLHDDGYLVVRDRPAPQSALHLDRRAHHVGELSMRRSITTGEHAVLALDRWPAGYRSALAVTGDIDALTVQDFWHRMRENGRPADPDDMVRDA
jgi:peptidoglycan/xylan/chitin deacetylase (PgdA/CDA1 family)